MTTPATQLIGAMSDHDARRIMTAMGVAFTSVYILRLGAYSSTLYINADGREVAKYCSMGITGLTLWGTPRTLGPQYLDRCERLL
jgi:hypothetical protein